MSHVAYLGNFRPTHSTENHIATAMRTGGHVVSMLQENEQHSWDWLAETRENVDMVLWTHTGGFPPDEGVQCGTFDAFRGHNPNTPIVGVHLDRWWGLPREDQITVERKPFFHEPDVLFTADGGHDDLWAEAGIAHRWFPPGVSRPQCEREQPLDAYRCDVAFVGSWQGHYHPEWGHRRELVDWLKQSRYDVKFFPRAGEPGIRGRRLRALYASCKVTIGDSCLVPRQCANDLTLPMHSYCSDRLPEATGRGALLLHPFVEGVTDGSLWQSGDHLLCWSLGDWDGLDRLIGDTLARPDSERAVVASAGRAHTITHHTYERRMADLISETLA